ncbi:MAG TPA: LuxR C-terminal-related transcriptional regulator [Candidatus Acidoferrum sp.]
MASNGSVQVCFSNSTPFNVQGLVDNFTAYFGDALVGAALFDQNCKILALNRTLAEMNRSSIDTHQGKRLMELFNEKCCPAAAFIGKVFVTGKPAHTQITAQLRSRNDEATWLVTFIPIKDDAGKVALVSAMVVETTKYSSPTGVLNTLFTNLPQIRDKVSYAYLTSQSKAPFDSGLLFRAVELSEHCYQALQDFREALQTPDDMVEASTGPSTTNGTSALADLTQRETRALQLLAEGKSNKEVADAMNITLATAQTYHARIKLKLNLRSSTEIVMFAIRTKLIQI